MTVYQVNTYHVDCDGFYEKDGVVGRCPVSVEVKGIDMIQALRALPGGWKVECPAYPGASWLQTTCGATHVPVSIKYRKAGSGSLV